MILSYTGILQFIWPEHNFSPFSFKIPINTFLEIAIYKKPGLENVGKQNNNVKTNASCTLLLLWALCWQSHLTSLGHKFTPC